MQRLKRYADFRAVKVDIHLDNVQAEAIKKVKSPHDHDKIQELLNNQSELSPCEELAMKDNTTRGLLRDSLLSDAAQPGYDPRATGLYIVRDKWPQSTALYIKAATSDPLLAESTRKRLVTIEALILMATQEKDLEAVIERQRLDYGPMVLSTLPSKEKRQFTYFSIVTDVGIAPANDDWKIGENEVEDSEKVREERLFTGVSIGTDVGTALTGTD